MDTYMVVGNPIAQSKSPLIHTMFAAQTEQQLEYSRQLLEPGEFDAAAKTFFAGQGKGINITMPFKQDAYNFADELSPRALSAGAVNTLIKREDGSILGENTDGVGLINDITDNLNWTLSGRKVLIIGAGGAVGGILLPLMEQNPAEVLIVNRTASKAEELAARFASMGNIRGAGYGELSAAEGGSCSAFDVIINGTSTSLTGDLPPIPPAVITNTSCVYDMVYGTEPTPFMVWAQNHGAAATADGLGMLVGQAAESFYLWRGIRPDIAPVMAALRHSR
ncbi:shikimate dehydrogenase [Saccharophagus degradans]|uniref:Shikimate dehydrogenase (NADP(+)) n=1 Tax=Saccharophagus degradans TaxID=86304 RepID=A0AAW7X4W3_9GAMM|nr:shikimate dehydrogenase [Saccharophagus degradans]MBU2986706.1 shikimate dehydrogenase [Saccharophagus degradans]MDO6422703.1 shikimate dehydrogenase [Saccharophagus degradans]MDO6609602.1 shikimate dehydrogenase [Saccharophagus degradans]